MDRYGYTWSIDYNLPFDDISSTGTKALFNTDDDGFVKIHLNEGPQSTFQFYFYGKYYGFLYANVNGFLSSDGVPSSAAYQNREIPSENGFGSIYAGGHSLIAPFWDDLDPKNTGNLYYQYNSVDGQEKTIIQWDKFGYTRNSMDGHTATFQVWLMPTNENRQSDVYFLYKEFTNNNPGNEYTVGIENRAGTNGLGMYHNTYIGVSNNYGIHVDSSGTR